MPRRRRVVTALPALATLPALSVLSLLPTPIPASAYDSIPTASAPSLDTSLAAERERLKREREARAAQKNTEVSALSSRVSAATTASDYAGAIDSLSLWVIAQGPPNCMGSCQWTTAETRSPLPEGFRTRELVATCKAALQALPRVSYLCEPTRENTKGICFSAGPQAEGAYNAFLSELKKRAPAQYETPYGPVSF